MSDLLLYLNYPSWLHPELFPGVPWLSFLRWYSLSYILGFLVARKMLPVILRTSKGSPLLSQDQSDELIFLLMVCIIIGGRLGYVFIYDPLYYFSSWSKFFSIFLPFTFVKNPDSGTHFVFTGISGLSYHGALCGFFVAIFIMSIKRNLSFWRIMDRFSPLTAFVYTFGRFGNFANQELYGKVTSSRLGMLFPNAEKVVGKESWAKKIAEAVGLISSNQAEAPYMLNLPRHPSQIYEGFFEGIFLGSILLIMVVHGKKLVPGIVTSVYLFVYGLVRFFIEYVREPDTGIGFVIKLGPGSEDREVFTSFLNFSLGQILCVIMMLTGIFITIFVSCHRSRNP